MYWALFYQNQILHFIGVLVFYSWVSNGVIGFHYPVSSKENGRKAHSSITQYSTSIAFLSHPTNMQGDVSSNPIQGKFSFKHLL